MNSEATSVEASHDLKAQPRALPLATGSAPRVRTIQPGRNEWHGRYKRHEIFLHRESRREDWWIQVVGPDGCYAYDGVWRKSAGQPRRAAVLEALHGAMLWPNRPGAEAPKDV